MVKKFPRCRLGKLKCIDINTVTSRKSTHLFGNELSSNKRILKFLKNTK